MGQERKAYSGRHGPNGRHRTEEVQRGRKGNREKATRLSNAKRPGKWGKRQSIKRRHTAKRPGRKEETRWATFGEERGAKSGAPRQQEIHSNGHRAGPESQRWHATQENWVTRKRYGDLKVLKDVNGRNARGLRPNRPVKLSALGCSFSHFN